MKITATIRVQNARGTSTVKLDVEGTPAGPRARRGCRPPLVHAGRALFDAHDAIEVDRFLRNEPTDADYDDPPAP